MREPKFGTWTAPECALQIEYSLTVIDEIRTIVTEGFQRLSRGGIEVGGVLYGRVDGIHLRILAMRPIACEHASGPTFNLSDNDRAALTAQLEGIPEDFELQSLTPVGWFVSHTRSEIALQQADLDTFNGFFSEPWQVALVVRPGRAGSMRAGFFVRESDGGIKTDRSYQDFLFPERQPLPFERTMRDRGPQSRRPQSPADDPESSASTRSRTVEETYPKPPIPENEPYPEYAPYPERHRQIPWAVIGVVVAAALVAILGLRYFGAYLNAEPISLMVSEKDGQLQSQWNRSSSTVVRASGGTLEIMDGQDKQNLTLTRKELTTGNLTYARKTGDVQIRMVVTGSGGQREEGSRFLGQPPEGADASEMGLVKVEKDALQDEVTRLREENTAQADHIKQLERTLTVMRTRMGISQATKSGDAAK